MGKKYDFDYIIIGSGPAGSAAAFTLAKVKKRIALVESHFFGGSNLNTRDVPYAVALDFAHTYNKILSYPEFKNQDFHFNFPTIAARELKTVIEAGGNNQKIYEDAGIVCLKGHAVFLDSHTITLHEKNFTADKFILATGSHLKTLEIAGTEDVSYLTPETAIKTHHLPKVVAVVGGGSSGCEIAEYFAELGSKVIIVESAPRLLPREDEEASTVISDYFTQKLGINILINCKVTALEQDNFSKCVIFHHGISEKLLRVDTIVLATGSEPNLDYGLENAGVKYKNTGILVNKFLETSAKNIYAAGDCLGNDSSTERADYEGTIIAANLVNKSKTTLNYKGFTRVTKTYPEVATIGLNEDDLLRRDQKYKKSIIKFDEILASHISNMRYGFVKLLADKKSSRIIGATIVSPHAELMSSEIALIIRHNLSAAEIASTTHPINNFNYAIKLAAKKLIKKN
ncbi:NAD(P)/FAD-dependent oxidoreductase [Candidatus Saccharibacteria bacterium]|nr:NAD(P)/FAD-dependent oxidoreductase [Candidatus Saccharibacteria bacterium]